jgi:hypothetical protein
MTQQREARFLNEWLMIKFPTALQWKRVRLGPIPDKDLGSLMKITLRWVDAVVFDGNTVFLIEAKLKSDLGAISQLKEYRMLFRDTPEFSILRDKPVEMILLIPFEWVDLINAAKREGIRVEIFKPAWLYKEMGWELR